MLEREGIKEIEGEHLLDKAYQSDALCDSIIIFYLLHAPSFQSYPTCLVEFFQDD